MVESVSLINETDLIFVYEIKSIEHTPLFSPTSAQNFEVDHKSTQNREKVETKWLVFDSFHFCILPLKIFQDAVFVNADTNRQCSLDMITSWKRKGAFKGNNGSG